jgi:DNA gyrase/topoisomerase IV subunit A
MGDIVLVTCIIYNQIHQRKVIELRNDYIELMKNRDELSGLLTSTKYSYDQLRDKLNHMETAYKELKIKQTKQAQETANLHACQDANLNFISQISEKNAEIVSLTNQLRDYEEMTVGMKKLFIQKLALEPTWIKAGESYTVSNGDFAVVVDEVSDKSRCQNGSTAVVSLMTGNEKKNLCVVLDRPEAFECKKKNYYLTLLGVRENEQNHEYLVSILK